MTPLTPITRRGFPWKLLLVALIGALVILLVMAAMSGMFDRHDHGTGKHHSSNIVPNLTRQWNSTKLSNRKGAIGLIAKLSLDDHAVYTATESIIEAATQDVDEQVRTLALRTLAEHHSPKLIPLARAQLSDKDPAVRLIGLRALTTAEAMRAAALVRQLINDPNPAVRATAVRIVARANRTAVDPVLLQDHPVTWQPTAWEAQVLAQYTVAAKQGSQMLEVSEGPTAAVVRQQIPLPETDLHNLAGDRLSITTFKTAFKGKPLLINFWDFAETNSVEMLGTLSALQKELAGNIQVIAIFTDQRDHASTNKCDHSAVDETGNHACKNRLSTFDLAKTAQRIQAEMERRHLTLQMFVDVSGRASHRFATDTLPASTLVNSEGAIERRFVGARPVESLRAMIAESISRSPSKL